jgi:hypothetical protein
MGDVIQFPQDPRSIEEAVRRILASEGLLPEAIDWIWTDMEPRLKEFSLGRDFKIPRECEDCAKELSDFARDIANSAMMEVLKLEIALYYAVHEQA